MSGHEHYEPSIHVVRHLAGRGKDAVEYLQTLVTRARDLLDSGTLTDKNITAYPWEVTRGNSPLGRASIWSAFMSDYASGAGLTTTLYASLATSEAELRRQLSREFNRDVADTAIVAKGLVELEKLEPGASALASPLIRKRLLALDRGEDRPAVFSLLARTHANYA